MIARYVFRRGFARAMLGLALLCYAAVAVPAADVLKHVPDSALAVVVVNNVEKGSEKIDTLAEQLLLPPPSVLNLLTGQANIDKGLNRQGSAAAIMFAPREGRSTPSGLLLLPASDYDALIAQLDPGGTEDGKTHLTLADKPMIAAKVGDYAAFVEPSDEKLLDEVAAAGTSTSGGKVVGEQVGDMTKWLAAQDAYALATGKGIALAADKVLEAMKSAEEQFEALGDEQQLETIKMAFALYSDLFKTAKSELSFAAAGLRGEEAGLHVTGRLTFKSGSAAAKLAAKFAAPKEKLLAGLPDGKFVFAFGGEIPAAAMEELYQWSAKMIRALPGGKDIKQEDLDEMIKLSAESASGLKSMTMAMYAPQKDQPLYSSLVGVMHVDNAEAMMASYGKSFEAMNELAKKVNSPFITGGTVEKTKIDGREALEVTMKIPDPTGAADALTAEMFKKMFGDAEKVKTYIVAADDKTVLMGYVTPDAVQRVIKSAGGKQIAANANLAKAAKLLPEGCQFVTFLSPKGAIDAMLDLVPGIELTPAPALLGDFPDTPPLGFGLKITPDGIESDLVVPEETLEAIGAAIARGRAVSIETR